MQPPKSLEQLQQDFTAAIFQRQEVAISAQISPNSSLTAVQRAGIYRHSVYGNMQRYLASVYRVCDQLVGEVYFRQLVYHCLQTEPPGMPLLADYGEALIATLRHQTEMQDLIWVADVAQLEWARHQSWHAPNQVAADFSTLAQLDEQQQERLHFELPHSAQLLRSPYAIHEIWQAHQPEAATNALANINLHHSNAVLIRRQERRLIQTLLTPESYQFLKAVQQGQTLSALTARFQQQLPTLLSNAIQQGWIRGYAVD